MIRLATTQDIETTLSVDGAITGLTPRQARDVVGHAINARERLIHVGDRGVVNGYVVFSRRTFFGRDIIRLLAVSSSYRRTGIGSAPLGRARYLLGRHGFHVHERLQSHHEGTPRARRMDAQWCVDGH